MICRDRNIASDRLLSHRPRQYAYRAKVKRERNQGSAAMSLNEMSPWAIVAVLSRIARHVQRGVEDLRKSQPDAGECQLGAVDKAIWVAEESGRRGSAGEGAQQLARDAMRVVEDARKDNEPRARDAALCAAYAATAVSVAPNRQQLLLAVERALTTAKQGIPARPPAGLRVRHRAGCQVGVRANRLQPCAS